MLLTQVPIRAYIQKAHTRCEHSFVQKPVQVHNDIAKQLLVESLESNVWQDYSYTFLSILQAQVLISTLLSKEPIFE